MAKSHRQLPRSWEGQPKIVAKRELVRLLCERFPHLEGPEVIRVMDAYHAILPELFAEAYAVEVEGVGTMCPVETNPEIMRDYVVGVDGALKRTGKRSLWRTVLLVKSPKFVRELSKVRYKKGAVEPNGFRHPHVYHDSEVPEGGGILIRRGEIVFDHVEEVKEHPVETPLWDELQALYNAEVKLD